MYLLWENRKQDQAVKDYQQCTYLSEKATTVFDFIYKFYNFSAVLLLETLCPLFRPSRFFTPLTRMHTNLMCGRAC